MKRITILIFAAAIHLGCHSQAVFTAGMTDDLKLLGYTVSYSLLPDSGQVNDKIYPGPAAFIEIAGRGYFSLNYEFRLIRSHRLSLGLGWNDMEVNLSAEEHDTHPYLILCAQYAYLFGRGPSYFELGGGFSYAFLDMSEFSIPGDTYEEPFAITGVIGYRRQVPNGFLFRVGFTPGFSPPDDFFPLIGLSFGYSW